MYNNSPKAAGQYEVRDTVSSGVGYATTDAPSITISEKLIMELDRLCANIDETVRNQQTLIDRLFGSMPEVANGSKEPTPNGAIAAIDTRLQWLNALSEKLYNNQMRLNKLG
jgi:hypothetical protein